MDHTTLTIIGAGAVGSAIAYELAPDISDMFVIDRKPSVREGENQSSRNSGVIHTGIYYDRKKVPLKAEHCPRGNVLLYQFCRQHQVPHRQTKELVVANSELDLEYLLDVKRIADENGVPGVEMIDAAAAQRFEPNVECIAALHVPTSGIIEPIRYVEKLQQLAKEHGTEFLYGTEVRSIQPNAKGFEVTIQTKGYEPYTFHTDMLINAAGLFADDIAKMVNPENSYAIRGLRGEAAKFYKTKRDSLWMNGLNVYPAPYVHDVETGEKVDCSLDEARTLVREKKALWTLGVHLTPTLGGYEPDGDGLFPLGKEVTVGPAKNKDFGKEDYKNGARPLEYYHGRARSFFPGLELDDLSEHQIGIMAVLKSGDTWSIDTDKKYGNCIHLLGISSPGLTASLSIAEKVKRMTEGLE